MKIHSNLNRDGLDRLYYTDLDGTIGLFYPLMMRSGVFTRSIGVSSRRLPGGLA